MECQELHNRDNGHTNKIYNLYNMYNIIAMR